MHNIKKLYWTIGEVSKELNVLNSKLIFWEEKFNWIVIKKNKKGHRQYTSMEMEDLIDVHILSRNGMTLKGIKKAYENFYYQELIKFFKDKEDKQLKLELC